MNKEPKKDKTLEKWTPEQEELLAEWAEKASGYRWLHSRSEKLYRKRNYIFTIPVIILSTLTGTANFAMDSFVPEEHKQTAMACVGGVNIFAGILSTLQNFLRYAELMEGHRVSEVSWSKFNREISVELALNPKMRKPAVDFLNVCRAEYDRLIEQSPTIDDSIIIQYKKSFKDTDINHPHVCNGLHKCKVYELSENEKAATIVAHAGEKFKLKHTLHHIRDNLQHAVDNNHHNKSINTNHTNDLSEQKNKNMKELDSLKGIGKVSGLKNKINPQNKFDTHQEELKTLIIPDKPNNQDNNDNTKKSIDLEILKDSKEKDTTEHDEKSEKTLDENFNEKKNIKVSINLDDEELKEGEYELFKGSLNKKDKKIDGDIFLVEKGELNKDETNENIIEKDNNNDIIIDVNDNDNDNDNEVNSDDTDSTETKNNMKDFLDEIK